MIDDIKIPDDSTRPIAPKLDLTDAQRHPMRHLGAIHEHHRRNMRVLRQVIANVGSGEASASDLQTAIDDLPILDNYRLFGNLCGQHCQIINMHHSVEDQHMFPALRNRSPGLDKVIDRLIAEHGVVHALLVRLSQTAAKLVDTPTPERFAEVVEIYQAFEKLLLSHFGYEEEEAGPALGFYDIGV